VGGVRERGCGKGWGEEFRWGGRGGQSRGGGGGDWIGCAEKTEGMVVSSWIGTPREKKDGGWRGKGRGSE